MLTGIASQPESWKALLVPVPGGLAIRDGSGFAGMLGMKAGDRMAQANGIALGGVDDVLVAFVKPLVASQPVRVTGTRDDVPDELPATIERLRRATSLPVCVGFGISNASQAARIGALADGIIVGSAIVKAAGESVAAAATLAAGLRAALDKG